MKRLSLFILFFTLIFAALPEQTTKAQISTDAYSVVVPDGQVVNFAGKVPGTQTYTTKVFSLPAYTNLQFGFQLKNAVGVSKAKISAYWQGSNFSDGTFANIDTLMTADSVLTETTLTPNLNGKKYPYYKLKIVGATGNLNTFYNFSIYPYTVPK